MIPHAVKTVGKTLRRSARRLVLPLGGTKAPYLDGTHSLRLGLEGLEEKKKRNPLLLLAS